MSQRRVTLSTVGLPDKIVKLASEDVTVKLAISLHAPDEETRKTIIPTAHAHTIEAILESAREYQRASGRRVTLEYAMLAGVNDAIWQAELLADILRGLVSHVNLIPMNPWAESGFRSSSETRIQEFYDTLEARGVPVSVRRSRGRDAGAACGQLAMAKTPRVISSDSSVSPA
jgi:23S rRNA (adenine2503-C2)-methyltransferase